MATEYKVKYLKLGSFNEVVILLCHSSFKTKRMSSWYILDHFKGPLKYNYGKTLGLTTVLIEACISEVVH